jgi:hypothetical protein
LPQRLQKQKQLKTEPEQRYPSSQPRRRRVTRPQGATKSQHLYHHQFLR